MKKDKELFKGDFISKTDAVLIQAFAVLIMVWHHLFGFPDRIATSYLLVFDSFFHIETLVAYFGKICIAIFAFCSGYGLRKKALSSKIGNGLLCNYKMIITQMIKFFTRYWFVFLVFVPLGFAIKAYSFDFKIFFKGFLGLSDFYNAEWWYVSYYVKFLLLFPIISLLFDFLCKKFLYLIHILTIVFVSTIFVLQSLEFDIVFFSVLASFILGMYFVEAGIYEKIYKLFSKKIQFFLSILIFVGVFILRTIGSKDYLLVPILIYAICVFFKNHYISRFLAPIFIFIGKYSTYIWLTHTFFAYYYFQKFTFLPYYSELIFILCLACSVVSGIVLEKLNYITIGKIFGAERKKSN